MRLRMTTTQSCLMLSRSQITLRTLSFLGCLTTLRTRSFLRTKWLQRSLIATCCRTTMEATRTRERHIHVHDYMFALHVWCASAQLLSAKFWDCAWCATTKAQFCRTVFVALRACSRGSALRATLFHYIVALIACTVTDFEFTMFDHQMIKLEGSH